MCNSVLSAGKGGVVAMERRSDDQKEKQKQKQNTWLQHGPCQWIIYKLMSFNPYFSICIARCLLIEQTDLTFEMISFEAVILVPVGFTLLISDRWVFGNMVIVDSFFREVWGICLLAFHLITHQLFLLSPICLLFSSQRLVRPTQLLGVMSPSPVHGTACSMQCCPWPSLPWLWTTHRELLHFIASSLFICKKGMFNIKLWKQHSYSRAPSMQQADLKVLRRSIMDSKCGWERCHGSRSDLGARSNRVLALSVGKPLPRDWHKLNTNLMALWFMPASKGQREVNRYKQWQLDFHQSEC